MVITPAMMALAEDGNGIYMTKLEHALKLGFIEVDTYKQFHCSITGV